MTPEATILLAVLAPVGAAILALGGKLLDRHLKLIDKIEERMVQDRTDRVKDRAVDRAIMKEILRAIGLEDKLDEIQRQVSNPDLSVVAARVNGTGKHGPISDEDADRLAESRPGFARGKPPGTYSKVRQ